MGKKYTEEQDRLDAFSQLDESEMSEGTSTYHKFTKEGEKVDGLFIGIEHREFEEGKTTECAILKSINGENMLFAQTIIVNELKKKWDETKETGFPVRIIFKGYAKAGTPDQYQNFRLLFEKPVNKS